jgi:hypothetical protein
MQCLMTDIDLCATAFTLDSGVSAYEAKAVFDMPDASMS